MSFSVLFVCTANICRSPLAERLLIARTPSSVALVVSSAGTNGLAGRGMDEASARALRELGGDPDGHVARRLSAAQISSADLVLTASSQHRAAVVQADPLAFRRTFTVREFARLGADFPLDPTPTTTGLRSRVGAIAAQRGLAEAAQAGADEIGDPFGAPWPQVQASAIQIAEAVDGVISALGLPIAPVT